MKYVFYNENFYDAEQPIVNISNRSFHYGDGFFETIRIVSGVIFGFDNHFNRVVESFKAFKITPPPYFSKDKLKNEIRQLLQKNNITEGGRVRVTFSRKQGGFFLPSNNEGEYFIEATTLQDNFFRINDEGLKIDIFSDFKKQVNQLSMYKSLNCNLFIQGSLYAQENNLDDAFIQNYDNTIIETTSSNIFIVSNGVLYTPSLSEGCLAGTMRMNIINIAFEKGIKVYECTLNPQYILAADEIFLTNAIQGVRWVSSYRSKRYFNSTTKEIVGFLNAFVERSMDDAQVVE